MTAKKLRPLAEAMLETADGMLRIGIMGRETHEQTTVRHLGRRTLSVADPIGGEEIRGLREKANLSQAGALTLLNVIRRKGPEAIL
jgi:putative transcriptional regulator